MKTPNRECNRCLFTDAFATIPYSPLGVDATDENVQCNYCDLHDKLEEAADPSKLQGIVERIRKAGRKKKYDCLIGISGGLDSSTLLYLAVRKWKLRPLVIHFDNWWNCPQAVNNMDNLKKYLKINSITYKVDKYEYDKLNEAFLAAGVPDADIPNDIAMTKLMYQTADMYDIKYILNGHDFRTEGSTPAKWTYMDARYIQDVYRTYTGKELVHYPLFTFSDQLYYALKGVKQVRPFHYIKERKGFEDEMKFAIAWQNYGGKHAENIYTEYVGAHLLPVKFGIDKRIVYLAAQVRSGKLKKEAAKEFMLQKPVFDHEKLGYERRRIMELSESPIQPREIFDRYDFKKWRPVIWLLAKLGVVPYTFYKKYCF